MLYEGVEPIMSAGLDPFPDALRFTAPSGVPRNVGPQLPADPRGEAGWLGKVCIPRAAERWGAVCLYMPPS